MSLPQRQTDFPATPGAIQKSSAGGDFHRLPVIMNAPSPRRDADAADHALSALPPDPNNKLKLINVPEGRKRDSAVVTGLRDLQKLQKQTVAVLEAVKGNLEDIRQVLRSPEATRGMEKQQNAAALLSKGFSAEAAREARGAAELLPANPDAHLLLSLSLAANQEYDEALAAARKGLALFDRRQHPLAIECGLLHAIAAMGHGGEAAQRWQEIVDALPLPVLLEHIGRIAVCYPSNAPEGQLDKALGRRIKDEPETLANEIPPASLFAGLDACAEFKMGRARRAILVRVTSTARRTREPAGILRFLGDFVVPMSERSLDRTALALAKRSTKQLLEAHADASTLHRALLKLELAQSWKPAVYIACLLAHWRSVAKWKRRNRDTMAFASFVLAIGVVIFTCAAAKLPYLPRGPWGHIGDIAVQPLHVGLGVLGAGLLIAIWGMLRRFPVVELPMGRSPLSATELKFLQSREAKETIRRMLKKSPPLQKA